MVSQDPKFSASKKEILELAAEEGHDADIPSNLGVVSSHSQKSPRASTSEFNKEIGKEIDVEKGGISGNSSAKDENEETPADADATAPEEPEDPNIVWWDGPNDPENPMNWPSFKRWGALYIVSGFTFLTPLASSMFAPGVPQLMEEFGSNNTLLEGFVVSVYVLGFAFGPLVIAPLSEMYGRLRLYHICNILFIIFTIACAVAKDLPSFIVFRFFEGVFGASPLALGGGTIADVTTREERGIAMAAWMMGPTAGPAVGPIAGGFVSQAKGWRWNFWIITMVAGAFGIFGFVFMSETYAPTILERKAERLRKETGNPNLRSKLDSGLSVKDLFLYSIVRPTKMLLFSPIVLLTSLYLSVVYTYLYIMFTTFTIVFEEQYHFGKSVVGLSYLGLGVGAIIGQFYCTWMGNRIYMKHVRAGNAKPEHRLPLMMQGSIMMPIGFFWYGWSVEAHTHWICPLIATGFIGFSFLILFMPASTYLVDSFHIFAASAIAASTVLRSACAAVIPLAGQKMYSKLGLGWGNSLLAFIAILFAPTPFLFIKYGEWLRTRFKVKL